MGYAKKAKKAGKTKKGMKSKAKQATMAKGKTTRKAKVTTVRKIKPAKNGMTKKQLRARYLETEWGFDKLPLSKSFTHISQIKIAEFERGRKIIMNVGNCIETVAGKGIRKLPKNHKDWGKVVKEHLKTWEYPAGVRKCEMPNGLHTKWMKWRTKLIDFIDEEKVLRVATGAEDFDVVARRDLEDD